MAEYRAQARRIREDIAATIDPLLRERLTEIAKEFDKLADEIAATPDRS